MNGKHMRLKTVLAGMLFTLSCATSQNRNNDQFQLAGRCEGCEAIFEYGDRPGVITLISDGNILAGERDFIFGKNIPGY